MPITLVLVTQPKFPLGQVVITANAQAQLSPEAVHDALRRHISGDWGELCAADTRENESALKHGNRLMSVYRCGEKPFWIITEADRSVTTVLMPDDY